MAETPRIPQDDPRFPPELKDRAVRELIANRLVCQSAVECQGCFERWITKHTTACRPLRCHHCGSVDTLRFDPET